MSSVDISEYVPRAEDINPLSAYQIANFFRRHNSISVDECNRFAANIIGTSSSSASASPTPVQGEGSFTVIAATKEQSKVVQFRRFAIQSCLLHQARQTYGDFVPNHTPRGMLADVHVYEMDQVQGVAFVRARRELFAPGAEQRLLRTVHDFARFFASAWVRRPDLKQSPDTARELQAHYSRLLDQLAQLLPARFQPVLGEVRRGLPLLFRPEYPMVLNHDDLLEMNIHVNQATGAITGIVDWADATMAPFGTSLWGLETLLGVQTSSRWLYHASHASLRSHFWQTFNDAVGSTAMTDDDRRAIEIGRLFGLLRTYGFDRRPEKEHAMPLGGQDLGRLEAFMPAFDSCCGIATTGGSVEETG